jgi:tRNA1(Val) A37 N6-methylase TrmN6
VHPDAPGPGESLDRLAGEWWIYQLRRGHRYATDDLLVAFTALQLAPGARRLLDLGSGVGSVGLLTLLGLPESARLTSVEAQEVSAGLCRRTLARNGLLDRAQVVHGDLRDPGVLPEGERFDLVLANPPFLPPAAATASPVPQRAAARLELRGDVFDYALAAARWRTPDGCFVFCHVAADPRPRRALEAAGLPLRCWRVLHFRSGEPPRLAVYVAGPGDPQGELPPLCARERDGSISPGWREVRRALLIDA